MKKYPLLAGCALARSSRRRGLRSESRSPQHAIWRKPDFARASELSPAADGGPAQDRLETGPRRLRCRLAGLQIAPFATGFEHPRMVYALPNGDVLVVESNGPKAPIYRLKDYVEGKVKSAGGIRYAGRQPHHPAARQQRRWRPGCADDFHPII